MNYTTNDIDFAQISHSEFERLCYELLLKYGYTELIWRQGGADNGRDIEGKIIFGTQLLQHQTKWFFECKHYTAGVPPEQLNAKIAWADSEQPGYLVIFVSSYITNNARGWLENIQIQKAYQIIVIEGEDLKNRLIAFPKLVEQFFSAERYSKLFIDIKRHWESYKIDPSFEVLKEVVTNIDAQKLTLNELGFLFVSFYKNYRHFEDRNDYYGDFISDMMSPLYDRLQSLSSKTEILLFKNYKNDYDWLGGSGFIDDLECLDPNELTLTVTDYQYNTLHLNAKRGQDKWAIGHYIFFKINEYSGFEIFCIDNTEFTTSARFYEDVTEDTVDELCLELSSDFRDVLREYSLAFQPQYGV